jgi:hypothetical protein
MPPGLSSRSTTTVLDKWWAIHAPDASVTAADNCADCDTAGKQRRPIDRGEVADRKEHRHFTD